MPGDLPKNIHVIWAGGEKRLPDSGIKNLAAWAFYNPGFTVTLWVDTKRPIHPLGKQQMAYLYEFQTEYRRLYKEKNRLDPESEEVPAIVVKDIRETDICLDENDIVDYCLEGVPPNYGMSSDILRYRILYKYGGVYVDATDVTTPEQKSNLEKMPLLWGQQNVHTLCIDHYSQMTELEETALKSFEISEISELNGFALDQELGRIRIGNDSFICTQGNPLMLKMCKLVENNFHPSNEPDQLRRLCLSHNKYDSTIEYTGPQIPQRVIRMSEYGDLKKTSGGKFVKGSNDEAVLIRPLRCEVYQATKPLKNTRNWANVLITPLHDSTKEYLFLRLKNSIFFEIAHMRILRLEDHVRTVYQMATQLKIDPESTCKDFLNFIQKSDLPLEKISFVLNCTNNPYIQEFVKENKLQAQDLIATVKDVPSAQECFMLLTNYQDFMRNPVFKNHSQLTKEIINQHQSPAEQFEIFNKLERAIGFIFLLKTAPEKAPFLSKLLSQNQKTLDLTPVLAKIISAYMPALLEKKEQIPPTQLYNVLVKLKEVGGKFEKNNEEINLFLKIGEYVKNKKDNPSVAMRNLAAENNLDGLKDVFRFYNVDINSCSSNGYTALHWAAEKGHPLVVDYLLQKGADPNITNNKGATASEIAHKNCFDLFIKPYEKN